ncbi:tetratricopeptide repeat protein [Desulfobacula sp.]|uniref:tetratricopeptide repeat protein n=1 Tax=Desulfobacula sp. TaxID=2593537 RepID=UPI0026060ACD|nr:tetratricopeptide repeat protein [Desulfobacula sp.]
MVLKVLINMGDPYEKFFSVFILFIPMILFWPSISQSVSGTESQLDFEKRFIQIEKQLEKDHYQRVGFKKDFLHLKDLNNEYEKQLLIRFERQNDKINFFVTIPAVIITILGVLGMGWVIWANKKLRKNWGKTLEEERSKFDKTLKEFREIFAQINGKWEQRFESTQKEMRDLHDGIKINELITAGNKLFSEKKFDEAIEKYNEVVEIMPAEANALTLLGKCYLDKKQYKLAIEFCDKALNFGSKNTETYATKGVAYFNLGKYPEALAEFGKVLEITPDDFNALYNKALCFGNLGKSENSLEIFEKLSKLYPQDGRIWDAMGISLTRLKRYKEALIAYETALRYAKSNTKIIKNYLESQILNGNDLNIGIIQNLMTTGKLDHSEIALFNFFIAIDKKIKNQDTTKLEAEIDSLFTQKLSFHFSFDDILDWVKNSDLDDEKKQYIQKLTEKMKGNSR